VARFTPGGQKLCAIAGLVATTYSSGGKTSPAHAAFANRSQVGLHRGRLGAHRAAPGYFGDLYQRHRRRGKKANTAIRSSPPDVPHRLAAPARRA